MAPPLFAAAADAAAGAFGAQMPLWVTVPAAIIVAAATMLVSERCRREPERAGSPGRRGSLFARVVKMRQAVHKSESQKQELQDREARMAHVDRRFFTAPRETVDQARAASVAAIWRKSPLEQKKRARQQWLVTAATSIEPIKVHNRLWVTYRRWVDERVALCEGKTEVFHNFVIAHALSIPAPPKMIWTGTDAGDLVSCMAVAGVLGTDVDGPHAIARFLEEALEKFNERFHLAQNRSVIGLSKAEQGEWEGGYDFVQLADPQIGMFHMDLGMEEELTMLRIAVGHVNRLKPKFLLVSGDITNAWPNEANAGIIAGQASAFKEALRELDPQIPLVLQPGNHDVGQDPSPADTAAYVARWGDDYFSFWAGGVLYIAINSQYYHKPCTNSGAAEPRAAQEKWVEEQFEAAAKSDAKHVVVLSHIAPFMGEEDEPHGHFNWDQKGRAWALKLARKVGVRLWLCGHFHGNYTGVTSEGMQVVTTSAVGGVINWNKEPPEIATNANFDFRALVNMPPVMCDTFHSGLRLVRVSEEGFTHEWFELAYVPDSFDEAFDTHGMTPTKRPCLEQQMGLPQSAGHLTPRRMRTAPG